MADQITDSIWDRGWNKASDQCFYPAATSSQESSRAQEFLHRLKARIDPHLLRRYGNDRGANYEDLYAAALQIYQDETSELVNPMLSESIVAVRHDAAGLYQDCQMSDGRSGFEVLLVDSMRLIQWTVIHGLTGVGFPVGLQSLSSMARATGNIDLFTLNHDLLIERELDRACVPFADGFGEKDGDVAWFDDSWDTDNPVRLYKLHGSLDWYKLACPGGGERFAKALPVPARCQNHDGEQLRRLNSDPLFLSGGVGKDRLYGLGLFGEVFHKFHDELRRHHTLICSGYGWSDKGINSRLWQWLHLGIDRRIVILYNENEGTDHPKNKPFWLKHWADLMALGKVVLRSQWLDECSQADLEPY